MRNCHVSLLKKAVTGGPNFPKATLVGNVQRRVRNTKWVNLTRGNDSTSRGFHQERWELKEGSKVDESGFRSFVHQSVDGLDTVQTLRKWR